MSSSDAKLAEVGVRVPNILFPRKDIDLKKWAVVACDQYTSEPEYWKEVAQFVGDSPSTLDLIFPETYLEEDDKDQRIQTINENMDDYLSQGILEDQGRSFFLVRRDTPDSPSRWGLIVALDLEQYDFSKGSTSLIRATEGTILDRIPPRKQIRKHAPIELPHIMVLIDDPQKSVIEPLVQQSGSFEVVYDFDLMKNGGHVSGYKIKDESILEQIADSLLKLADSENFRNKYGADDILLFAMGDGNHSLATAKSVWEDVKKAGSNDPGIMNHPARWALVEIENIYDEGLIFEAIHRVVFNSDFAAFQKELEKTGDISFQEFSSPQEVMDKVESAGDDHVIGYIDAEHTGVFTVKNSSATIAAGTAQQALDELAKTEKTSLDYIHGLESTVSLGSKKGNFGILLPALDKSDFFKTVIHDGALPRKTFSMGEAHEKRYYIEARKIK